MTLSFIIVIFVCYINGRVDMGAGQYGNILFYVLGAYAGIIGVIEGSKCFHSGCKMLSVLGKHSIVIYLWHIFPVVIMNILFQHAGIIGNMYGKIIIHLIAFGLIGFIIVYKEKYRD